MPSSGEKDAIETRQKSSSLFIFILQKATKLISGSVTVFLIQIFERKIPPKVRPLQQDLEKLYARSVSKYKV